MGLGGMPIGKSFPQPAPPNIVKWTRKLQHIAVDEKSQF